MKAKISELMDGELEGSDAARALSALREEGEVRDAWRTYHLIGDALRDTGALSHRFSERLVARLAEEPTVLAPLLPTRSPAAALRRFLIPTAATAAAVAMVGWLAFAPQPPDGPTAPQLARAPEAQPVKPAAVQEPARVPLPIATDDYLLAHQGYSPRNLLQGVVPYARTVSGTTLEKTR